MSISIDGKEISSYVGELRSLEEMDGVCKRQDIKARPMIGESLHIEEMYTWNGDIMDIKTKIVQDLDEKRLSNIANHFQVDLSEIRQYIHRKREKVGNLSTNADRIRGMSDEELAEFVVHRDCCPGFYTGTFSDANRIKYGFDGRSERCEWGGEECIACWLDWLKEEAE